MWRCAPFVMLILNEKNVPTETIINVVTKTEVQKIGSSP